MVLEKMWEKYHGLRYSLGLWKEATRGKLKKTKLVLASKVGSKDAEAKLAKIKEFEKSHPGAVIPAEIYDRPASEVEKRLTEMHEQLKSIMAIEQKMAQLKLDKEQKELAMDMILRAKRNPRLARGILGTLKDVKKNSKSLAKNVDLLSNNEIKTKWRRFIGWKALWFLKPKDIREFYEQYKGARKQGVPLRAAGKYFSFYEKPKLADAYVKLLKEMDALTRPPWSTRTPKIIISFADPERIAKLADLMMKMANTLDEADNANKDGKK